ncbi:MAG: tetratricopeptide repeat protein [Planctomycetota bacterium]
MKSPVAVAVLVVLVLGGAVALLVILGRDPAGDATSPDPLPPELEAVLAKATYVGREACAPCHEEEDRAWKGSHHDLAMDLATDETVLGDFDDAEITHFGVTSKFYRRDGGFFVETQGPDGKMAEFPIEYVFGVTPLQQYLVPFPGGRYQVLQICWDARPEADGGQRWYHIYPDDPMPPGDVLHWAGPNMTWNYVCAECHSTDLRKNWDLGKREYATAWNEIDVSCEACHGPGSAHVEWVAATEGLAEKPVDWRTRTKMLAPSRGREQIEVCARCHSRRVPISAEADYLHGKPLLDTHRLSLLEERLYHADGQILDEVYVYGSFLQSRMFREGIVCSNCHDPHSMRTYRTGNALCNRCHDAGEFDTPKHHFHEDGKEGSLCVECHAPETTYMVVDPRRDHSFRIPRPDLSDRLGTPNACNGCHDDQTNEWSVEYVKKWYGEDRRKEVHYGEALHAGREGLPGASDRLKELISDRTQPAIARATALDLLRRRSGAKVPPVIRRALSDEDALVRAAAVRALEGFPASQVADLGLPRLSDPVRLVRIEAARILATVPSGRLSARQRKALAAAVGEYVASEVVNSDRGASHTNLGNFHAGRGDAVSAERAYRTAISVEPGLTQPYANLADLLRTLDRDAEGEKVLREALTIRPDDAAIHHALGLLLVRRGRPENALVSLERAAALLPDNARFTFVYAVALDSTGRSDRAVTVLTEALDRHPTDPQILSALATMLRDRGRLAEAIVMATRLVKVAPEDRNAQVLLQQLRAAHRK